MKVVYPGSDFSGHASYQQQVRESNIKHVFDLVRSGKCTSRSELARALNLSATSASALVETLTNMGLVMESGPQRSIQPGRKPISLRFNNSARQLAMFDVTSRQVRFALMNLGCRVIESYACSMREIDLNAHDTGERFVRVFEDILENHSQIFDPERLLAVGISFPGHYSPSQCTFAMDIAMNICVEEASLQRFARRLGVPVCFGNVTMCRAYAQKKYLDAIHPEDAETKNLLYVDIGANVGGAVIADGQIDIGPSGIGGEIGHMSIDCNGLPCACGSRGCLERYVNLNALLDRAREACAAGGETPPEDFAALAAGWTQSPAMTGVVEACANELAAGIYNLFCATGISRVIVGGGIEALGPLFLSMLYKALTRRTLLADTLQISFAAANPNAESAGLAHYFMDWMMVVLGN